MAKRPTSTHLVSCEALASHGFCMLRAVHHAGRREPHGCEAGVHVRVAREPQRSGAAGCCADCALQRRVAARRCCVCQPERGAAQRAGVLPAGLGGGGQVVRAQRVEARERRASCRKEAVHQRRGVRRKGQHERQRHGHALVAGKRAAGGCALRCSPCGGSLLAPLDQPPQQVQQPRAERGDGLEARRCGG